MIVEVEQLLTEATVSRIKARVESASWVDGRQGNPEATLEFKNNLELASGSALTREVSAELIPMLRSNERFKDSVLPKYITELTIARYTAGMHYSGHLDSPIMGADGDMRRSDMSFTIFLAGPDEYEGGELVLESGYGTLEYKGALGDVIAYPTTMWHEVRPVTSGTRLVAVGWLQSYVRDQTQRQLLADMKRCEETQNFRELTRLRFNLMKMWADF